MSKSKVIFVNRVYRPSEAATAQLLTDLAEGLAARGWNVHVIAAGESTHLPGGVTVHRTGRGDRHGGPLSRVFNYLNFLRAARRLVRELAGPRDLVVLMTDPPLLALSATGPVRQRGARVIQWIQDIYPEIVPQHYGAWAGWLLLPLKWLRNRAWRASSACCPVGDDMRTPVAAARVAPGRLVVLPNWAPRELETMPPDTAVTAYQQGQRLPDHLVIGYSGNLGRVHEFQTVLDAAQRLVAASAPVSFRITGSGPQLAVVEAARRVHRLGNLLIDPPVPRADLALSLAASQAHLVTLRPGFESLVNPSKLAGILAAGRPVLFVGPPDSAIARFIQSENVGAVIAPGDATALTDTIAAWADNHGAGLVALGRNARASYTRHFTLAAALDRWEQLLRDVAADRL